MPNRTVFGLLASLQSRDADNETLLTAIRTLTRSNTGGRSTAAVEFDYLSSVPTSPKAINRDDSSSSFLIRHHAVSVVHARVGCNFREPIMHAQRQIHVHSRPSAREKYGTEQKPSNGREPNMAERVVGHEHDHPTIFNLDQFRHRVVRSSMLASLYV